MSRQAYSIRCILLLSVLCLPIFSLLAQEIQTSAPDEVLENEVFQIQYDIISQNAIQEMPALVANKEFELVSEPQIKRSYPSPFSRTRHHTFRLAFAFKAKKTGKLNLPRIELVISGHKLSSKKGTILVREMPEMGDVDCFVDVSLSREQVKVGDTLSITYKLYTTKEISNVLSINAPRLNSFNYQDDTPRRAVYANEIIGKREYKVYVIRKLLLQAKSLGVQGFSQGEVEVEYTYPTGRTRSDQWGREYEEQMRETKICPIKPISVLVHDMIAI